MLGNANVTNRAIANKASQATFTVQGKGDALLAELDSITGDLEEDLHAILAVEDLHQSRRRRRLPLGRDASRL